MNHRNDKGIRWYLHSAECNRYLGNKWMAVHMWQLSQDKTTWQYNQLPTTDKTNVSQNGIRRGTHEEASEGVCRMFPRAWHWCPHLQLRAWDATNGMLQTETMSTRQLMLQAEWWQSCYYGQGSAAPPAPWDRKLTETRIRTPHVRTRGHYTLRTSTRCKTYFDPNKHVHNSSEGQELYRNARETKPLMKG